MFCRFLATSLLEIALPFQQLRLAPDDQKLFEIVCYMQEPLLGETICPRDQSRSQFAMYHGDGLKILNLDLRGLGREENLKAVLDFSGSSGAGLFAECAHLECCTEVRVFVACFICTWPANSPFLFVSIIFCTTLLINILICNILRSRAIQHQ